MIACHSYTWFKIKPRTLPPLKIGRKRLSAAAITAGWLAAALAASAVLLGLARGVPA